MLHVFQHSVNIYLFKPYCSVSSHFEELSAHALLDGCQNQTRPVCLPAGSCWRCWSCLYSPETGCSWLCVTLTSPHGPGSLTRPAHRWCRVCHRRPGCCVCSEPPSSGTPDSSCPAATCSTTRQPPSHPTLYPLRYTGIRPIEVGRDYEVCQTNKRLN